MNCAARVFDGAVCGVVGNLRNRKINAPVARVLCQCNAAVMPDRCSVRPMARDRGCPRVLHRLIRARLGTIKARSLLHGPDISPRLSVPSL